jgi:hypothetical protein
MAKQHQLWLAFKFSKQIADASNVVVKGLMRSKVVSQSSQPRLFMALLEALHAPRDLNGGCMP